MALSFFKTDGCIFLLKHDRIFYEKTFESSDQRKITSLYEENYGWMWCMTTHIAAGVMKRLKCVFCHVSVVVTFLRKHDHFMTYWGLHFMQEKASFFEKSCIIFSWVYTTSVSIWNMSFERLQFRNYNMPPYLRFFKLRRLYWSHRGELLFHWPHHRK